MTQCKACTKELDRCTKNAFLGSRYCFLHQDLGSWLMGATAGAIISLIIAVAQVVYQGATPLLDISCSPPKDDDFSRLGCTVENRGRAEARDVLVGFNHSLPLETRIIADPDLGITLTSANSPPNPTTNPMAASTILAFSVAIPRVPPKAQVHFEVATHNADNRRAAKQLARIRAVQQSILSDFTKVLRERFPDKAKDWKLEALLAFHAYDGNFFKPDRYSYELGRYPVKLLPEEHQAAKARDDEIYAEFKPRFREIWQGRPPFAAPVIRIETATGPSTYATFPADVRTCIFAAISRRELLSKDQVELSPPVPEQYNDEACN